MMKLFKITDPNGGGYDRFSEAVVVASDESEARLIHPAKNQFWAAGIGWVMLSPYSAELAQGQLILADSARGLLRFPEDTDTRESWAGDRGATWSLPCDDCWPSDPQSVTVEYLGESIEDVRRVVVADYLRS